MPKFSIVGAVGGRRITDSRVIDPTTPRSSSPEPTAPAPEPPLVACGGPSGDVGAMLIALGLGGHLEPEAADIYIGTHEFRFPDNGTTREFTLSGTTNTIYQRDPNLGSMFSEPDLVSIITAYRWVIDVEDWDTAKTAVTGTFWEHASVKGRRTRFGALGCTISTAARTIVKQATPADAEGAALVQGHWARLPFPRRIDWKPDEVVVKINQGAESGDVLTFCALQLEGVTMGRDRFYAIMRDLEVGPNALAVSAGRIGMGAALRAYLTGARAS